jgi:predicted transcriptional regulator
MTEPTNPVELATELTIAWLSNPNTRTNADDVPAFLQSMHDAVARLSTAQAPAAEPDSGQEHVPAVTVRKSLASREHIISLIDGKPYKTLRRHLATNGLTPAQYRERYGLKADYPMVAPAYSESRSAMAKTIGLGRKPGATKAVDDSQEPSTENGSTSAE